MAKSRTQKQARPIVNKAALGWPQAVRDIVVASMKTGQLPVLLAGTLFGLMLYKMTPTDVAKLATLIVEHMYNHQLIGYAFGVLVTILWRIHVRWIRRETGSEYDRMGREKSAAQDHANGKAFDSSGARRIAP